MRYLFIVLVVSGCSIAGREQASIDLMQSKRAYKECIERGGKCDKEKRLYEADAEAYQTLKREGFNNTIYNK